MNSTAELVAGRELDVLVAEKVMGWHVEFGGWVDSAGVSRALVNYWSPSTDIAAAWQVVEQMDEVELTNHAGERWLCRFWLNGREGQATAEAVPLAICRAALAATAS